ncbi:MAG TPA: zf-HC2 domain-containing protein [Rhizomicrobium sp.]|nr:zf-HC2 domain-containing protein [Rhizomicrobium sp.]
MSCTEHERTQLLADGELSGEDARAARAHLNGCAACAAQFAEIRALGDAVRAGAMRYRAPARVAARVRKAVAAEGAPRRGFWLGAASGVGASALAAALALAVLLPPSAETLADRIADSHVKAMMQGPLIEVASSDHHTVKPWFAGKIDLSPPVKDFKAQGFALQGGRLDHVDGYPAAVLVYRHGGHVVDLYVWHGARAAGTATRHGYAVQSWVSGDLDYSAVCDAPPSELRQFVKLVRGEED